MNEVVKMTNTLCATLAAPQTFISARYLLSGNQRHRLTGQRNTGESNEHHV